MRGMYCLLICSLFVSISGEVNDIENRPTSLYDSLLTTVETRTPKYNYRTHLEPITTIREPKSRSFLSSMSGFFQKMSTTLQIAMVLSTASTGGFPTSRGTGSSYKRLEQLNYTTAEAGNPFIDGWYADPDTAIYDGIYWVFPTSSYAYEEQTYLDAFSSPDLINWTKHPNILTTDDVKWAKKAVWAPAPAFRNEKYYLYFGANDIQEGEAEKGVIGGIGVAVADDPQGPYIDPLGKPLIGEYHNGAQPIDQDVFIDDDGQAYIYYGGHSFANVAKLNDDMTSLGEFDDGTVFKNITPTNYVEGSQMMKRDGTYYFMWSEGGWGLPDYSVSYAMSDSPLGPFERKAQILQQDSAVAKSSGHNGVIQIPNTDIYYIFYHRRPLSDSSRDHRELAYDRMYFNEDGTIAPVRMLVKDNFADGNMIGWKTYGGEWNVVGERLKGDTTTKAMALLDTNFTDLVFDATIDFSPDPASSGSAGLVFRANATATSGVNGYYVGLSPSGILSLETFQFQTQTTIANATISDAHMNSDADLIVRVKAIGDNLEIYVDDLEDSLISVKDATFSTGANGVMVVESAAKFGFVSVLKPDEM
jgi:hypothetical protein